MKQGIFMREMAAESKEAIIDVVGVIGWDVWYGAMRDMLKAIPDTVERVVFDIYSPGGDIWDGNAIVNAIGALKQETVARVQVAASMATTIAMACKTREIASNGRWLIHNPWSALSGDASTLEKRAKELRDCEVEAAKFYADRTGQTVEAMTALMAEERWLTPDETKELGFVQSVNDPFDSAKYSDVKAAIVAAGKWPKSLVEIPKSEDAEVFDCECIDCGDTLSTETHCKDLKCEKCGGQMRRKERPGPGEDSKGDKKDDDANTDGAKGDAGGANANDEKPTDDPVKIADAAGYARGITDTETKHAKDLTGYTDQIAKRDTLIKSLQSAKDKSEAHVVDMEAKHTEALAEQASKNKAAIDALQKTTGDAAVKQDGQIKELTQHLADANTHVGKLLGGGMTFEPTPVETWEEALQLFKGDYVETAKKYPGLRDAYNEKNRRK